MKEKNALCIMCTTPDETVAEKIARAALESRVAACVQILPPIKSMYWWQGNIEEDSEILLLIKTSQNRLEELTRTVKSHHPYDVPEISAVPITGGSPEYLDWIFDETSARLK